MSTSADWTTAVACSGVSTPASALSNTDVSRATALLEPRQIAKCLFGIIWLQLWATDERMKSQSGTPNLSTRFLQSGLARLEEKAVSKSAFVASDSVTKRHPLLHLLQVAVVETCALLSAPPSFFNCSDISDKRLSDIILL